MRDLGKLLFPSSLMNSLESFIPSYNTRIAATWVHVCRIHFHNYRLFSDPTHLSLIYTMSQTFNKMCKSSLLLVGIISYRQSQPREDL